MLCLCVQYGAYPLRCRGVNMFSPEGRLFQVEYAIEAIKLGSTALGICTREGVVLAVEKRVTSSLMEPDSILKIMEVDSHICAYGGLACCAARVVCPLYKDGPQLGVTRAPTRSGPCPSLCAPGCAMSGLIADSRTMVEKARVEAQVGGVWWR